MNYYVTSIIHLSLEPFHNAGLTPEETGEIISSLTDPCSSRGMKFWIEKSGINHNWNIRTSARSENSIERIVELIVHVLCQELVKKGKEIPFSPPLFSSSKKLAKLHEVLCYDSISVEEVLSFFEKHFS